MSTDSITWSVVRSEGDKISIVVERDVNGAKETKELWVQPTIPEKTHWWNRKNLRTIGILPSYSFVVGEVQKDSAAEKAGLQVDDVVTAINGEKLLTPDGLYEYRTTHPAGPYDLTIERPDVKLPAGGRVRWSDDVKMIQKNVSFDPKGVKVTSVEKESPASRAGLQKDDIIESVDGTPTNWLGVLVDYIGKHAGVEVTLQVQRAGQSIPLKVTPLVPLGLPPQAEKLGRMGAVLESLDGLARENLGKSRLIYPKPGEQVHQSVMAIVNTLDAVFSRKSSIGVQQMGGPVMMMNAYYHMLSSPDGIRMAIWFSVILNVNLALLNLLPIPVLDGGHITLAIIEAVRRKPMNVRVLEYVQTTCAMAIIGFMLFIMFFDVQDIHLPFVDSQRETIHFPKAGETGGK
jgi:regulator of sigma E protease